MRALLAQDPEMLVWSKTPLEVTSALWCHNRSAGLAERVLAAAAAGLADLEASWHAVIDLPTVVARARRLLGVHALPVADAAQLAACLLGCGEQTDSLAFVTLDERLAAAARREGLRVLPDPDGTPCAGGADAAPRAPEAAVITARARPRRRWPTR